MSGSWYKRHGGRGGHSAPTTPVFSLPRDQSGSHGKPPPSPSPSPSPSVSPAPLSHRDGPGFSTPEQRFRAPPGSGASPSESLTGSRTDESQGSDGNWNKPFDIFQCPSKTPGLKPSLLESNKEKRAREQKAKSGPGHQILRQGMVLLKNYLDHNTQVDILKQCRELGLGPGGFYRPGYNDGAKLNLWMMCLGKNWDPETRSYEVTRSHDGAEPPPIPGKFKKLVEDAMQRAQQLIRENTKRNAEEELPGLSPDLCIVNFYKTSGKLGLHQDKDESEDSLRKRLPVVSFSIGDSAHFEYGDARTGATAELILESGDVLIFGGESRNIFHGVTSIEKNTAPKSLIEETSLQPGRLNLTFRQY